MWHSLINVSRLVHLRNDVWQASIPELNDWKLSTCVVRNHMQGGVSLHTHMHVAVHTHICVHNKHTHCLLTSTSWQCMHGAADTPCLCCGMYSHVEQARSRIIQTRLYTLLHELCDMTQSDTNPASTWVNEHCMPKHDWNRCQHQVAEVSRAHSFIIPSWIQDTKNRIVTGPHDVYSHTELHSRSRTTTL